MASWVRRQAFRGLTRLGKGLLWATNRYLSLHRRLAERWRLPVDWR